MIYWLCKNMMYKEKEANGSGVNNNANPMTTMMSYNTMMMS